MWVAKGAKSLSSKSKGVNYQSTKQYNSSAFDFRRIALRQQWKLSPKSDADVFTYPNERLGNCYDLNWALCALKVIPVHNAYRNLHIRGLQMLSESTTDASKAVKVSVEEPAEHSFYFVGESGFSGANLDTEGFKYLLRDVRKYLSDSEHIFTHDGAVGSHASSEVTLRTISNNANSALFLKHALHKVPLRNPKTFEANFTVFIVPKFSLKKGLYGITSPNFTAIDTTNKRIVVAGTQSFSALQKSLLTLTTPHFVSNNILPVSADVILTNGNRNVLVFSDSGSLSQTGVSNVFSASNSLWAPSSVTRAFNSANLNHVPSNITRGDLVNTVGKEVTVTKTFSPEVGNILGHPFAVAFVVNSKDSSSPAFATLSKEQAKTLFKQSVARSLPNYNSDALSTAFEERLDSLNIPAVLVTGSTSNADVAQKIQSLSQSIPSEKVPGNLFTN